MCALIDMTGSMVRLSHAESRGTHIVEIDYFRNGLALWLITGISPQLLYEIVSLPRTTIV